MRFYSLFGKADEAADFSLRLLTASSEKLSLISLVKLELCSTQAEPDYSCINIANYIQITTIMECRPPMSNIYCNPIL